MSLRSAPKLADTLKWVVLVALAWSQFSLAAHQFDHSLAEDHTTCAVCVQLDRDDDVTASQGGSLVVPPAYACLSATSPAFELAPQFNNFRSRASP